WAACASVARLSQFRGREFKQVVALAAGCEEIVESDLGSLLARRQVHESHVRALVVEKALEGRERLAHLRLDHDVRIERDVDPPAGEREMFPVGQRALVGILVSRPTEAPYPDQVNAAQAEADRRVCFPYPFGDPEWGAGVDDRLARWRRHIDDEA